ncbi:MAG: alanine racemase [Peptoclostridium sp.]|uniref:alanine racemase n=1 Tax=Peptoclostridium sp. TaxID=1904860 RepID=UPI00139EA469|nr:alanine racemase [Peptoclostridium sp.]MZQ75932.1 alanine racemase [Peptoclostridium sp.]
MKYKNRPWAEINVENLRENFRNIKSLTKEGTKVCAVVKANAYGHGSVQVAKILIEEGADYLAVASEGEAIELRQAGIKTPILCLGYVPEVVYEEAIANELDITIYSLEAAEKLSKEAVRLGKNARVHIKLDTGMSRLGFQVEDATVDAIEKIAGMSGIELVGVFTHFAKADEKDKTFTEYQYSGYMKIVSEVEKRGVKIQIKHVCNSAGTMDMPQYHMDMVRPGIILYGLYPSDEVMKERLALKPVMTFKASVSHVKDLEAGRGIGYGLRYVTDKTTRIATMPIGYADGFTRMLSGKISVKVNGTIVPVVGNICMDQSMLNVDAVETKVGDEVIIFGEDSDARVERLAQALGTINYEIVCMVARRIPRVYMEKNTVLQVVDYLVK